MLLWRFPGYAPESIAPLQSALPIEPWRIMIASIQALVFILTLLLAIPTGAVMPDARPKRYLPGLIESDEELANIDPLAGDQDVENN